MSPQQPRNSGTAIAPLDIRIGSSDEQAEQDIHSRRSVLDDRAGFIYGSPDVLTEYPPVTSADTFVGESSISRGPEREPTPPPRTFPLPPHPDPRPPLGSRSISSVSSPATSSARRRAPTLTARVSGGLQHLTQRNSHRQNPTHEWTLFGQMMENEGQLPSPDPSRASRATTISGHSLQGWTTVRSNGSNLRGQVLQSPLEEGEDGFREVPHDGASSSETQSQEAHGVHDYDSAYDSDSSASSQATVGPPPATGTGGTSAGRSWFSLRNLPTLTLVHRNVLKCSIAYLIASLFTFSPILSNFIGDLTSYGPGSKGPSPSGHMVATIAVYFNPAKTVGAMIEADLFCLMGVVFSAFVCAISMSMFWWLELQPGWEWLGDVVAIMWIGFSMSLVAWMKVWMASPSFNTACSMTTILIFLVIIKEGGLQNLLGVSTIVLCGSLISNLVCYLIWPQSATHNLRNNMAKTLDSFSTLLSMLTNGFLLENEIFIQRTGVEKIQKAVEAHQSSFTSLKKNLAEAKKEWLDTGESTSRGVLGMAPLSKNERKRAYQDAVESLNRLAQHLNGLRSSTRLQYDLTKAGVHRGYRGKGIQINDQGLPEDENLMIKAAAELFGALVDEVGSPLKALTKACTTTLNQLREAFLNSRTERKGDRDSTQPPDFVDLIDGIEKALVRFESTSNHALLRLYKRSDLSQALSESLASLDLRSVHSSHASGTEERNNLLTSSEHEHVFLVYFFIFTLQELARELVALVDAIERIYECEQRRLYRRAWIFRVISNLFKSPYRFYKEWRNGTDGDQPQRRPGLRRRLSAYLIPEHRIAPPGFPKIEPHAPNTIQTPSPKDLPFIGRVKQRVWAIGARMKDRDIKFALKAGMATAMLAAPAFFDATRPFFVENWGDWALISFFIVISPTIGATNYLSLHRVLGTIVGAAVAAAIYLAFPENAIVLTIFGFFFSLPCFYIAISRPQYLSASRFVLLTYNLTCLYCYNVREKEVFVHEIALQRALSVIVGVLWAALVSRFWWPSEARRELSKGLGDFCLNIGWLYTRLVASNSYSPEYRPLRESNDEAGLLLHRSPDMETSDSIREFMAMELHLQIKLIELQGLLAQAQHEPRFKGPFPVSLYRNILTSLQTILDKLHSMRCVTTKEEWHTSVRRDFIIPVNKERREMVGNIILGFTLLASAFRLKAPLPPYLPPAEKARQRLVDAIRKLDVVRNREVGGSRQLLFFAYAMAMQGVTQELETLGKVCQGAFGVIGQTPEEFEALFFTSEDGISHVA